MHSCICNYFLSGRDIDGYSLKMANNNLSATSTTSAPFFVPRIVMICYYDQSTQTRITQTINNYIQTDTPTLITSATQTDLSKVIKQLRLIHNKILKLFKQTFDLMEI